MEQIDLLQQQEITKKIESGKRQIGSKPYDLIAVNKMYNSYVVLNKTDEKLYTYFSGELQYQAPAFGSDLGTNLEVIDERFRYLEAVELTNAKRQYTTCARYQLQDYLNDGWRLENE